MATGPAGRRVAQAVAAGLRLAALDVAELDSSAHAAASGRLVLFCLPLDQLATATATVAEGEWADGYRVLIPAGETAALPPGSQAALDQMDEVWAPTRFLQAALVCRTDRSVLHMPAAWQFAGPGGSQDGAAAPPDSPFRLAVADGLPGSGERQAALLAYRYACADWPGAPPMVLEATDACGDELNRMIAATPGVSVASPRQVDTLAANGEAGCLMSLHRGEALGLAVVHAMARGVPVVATDYGGCTDVLTPQTGFPVEYRLEGGAAAVDPRHAAWWLRRVFDRPDAARRRAAAARRAVASACDPARVAAAQAQRLGELGLLPALARRAARGCRRR